MGEVFKIKQGIDVPIDVAEKLGDRPDRLSLMTLSEFCEHAYRYGFDVRVGGSADLEGPYLVTACPEGRPILFVE